MPWNPSEWIPALSIFRGSGATYARARANIAQAEAVEQPARERYAVQWAYYANNRLYEDLARWLYERGVANRAVRGLRNPAFRIVEFYPATLWPGDLPDALPIRTDNQRIIEPIQQIWKWSGWAKKKQLFARQMPLLGDAFIRVVRNEESTRVHFQLLDPSHVTDFRVTPRNDIVEIRIDIPQVRVSEAGREDYWHTEHWSRDLQAFRRWEHANNPETDLDELGPPTETRSFESMGIDFVPMVHAPFQDVGELRGVGAFWLQLDKIDQINAEATRLSQMLFRHNKPTLALIGGKDAANRPLPPPRLATSSERAGVEVLEERDESVFSLPGNASVQSLVPGLNYQAHLEQIGGLMDDLKQDRPELAWAQVVEVIASNVSGRAMSYALAPAIKKAQEVRGNGEDAMIKAAEMGLTMARGLPDFGDYGTYEQGDFEHTFETRPVFPIDENDLAITEQARALAFKTWREAGLPILDALLRAGYTEPDARKTAREMEKAAEEAQKQFEERQNGAAGNGALPEGPGRRDQTPKAGQTEQGVGRSR